jgi:hypothetical protein
MEKTEMSKRQFLEKMIENLIENDVETARANFHQFVVESAREIHASLIETDELDHDIDEEAETVEEAEEVMDFGADVDAGEEVEMGDEMEMAGEMEMEPEAVEGDESEQEAPVEIEMDDFEELKSQLAALQAKFDSLNPESDDSEEAGMADEMEMGPVDDSMGDEMEESFDLTEDDLLGLEESWTEVKVSMNGEEQGGGKFAGSEKNTTTPIATREKAEGLGSTQTAHKGYEREKAPAVPMKNDAENVSPSGKKEWSEVKQHNTEDEVGHGEKFATPAKSTTTPIAKK